MLRDICSYLDTCFADLSCPDFSNNGLQVEAGKECHRVAFAVDACLETLQKAADGEADLLVVHHGISWGNGFQRLTGMDAARFQLMFRRGVSLYAMHLPLDGHPLIGNNAVLARRVELSVEGFFCECRGLKIGTYGRMEESLSELLKRVQRSVCPSAKALDNTQGRIHRLGIVSGKGDSALLECSQFGIDCLLTGEFSHQYFHTAQELGISVIIAGHYDTERTGIQELMSRVEASCGVQTFFIEAETNL